MQTGGILDANRAFRQGYWILARLFWTHFSGGDGYLTWLRRTGMRIGEGTRVYDPKSVLLDQTRPWLVEIGRNVQIGRGVSILTHGYEWAVVQGVYGDILGSAGKVTIGDNVFLGVNVTVLKGVTIGSNSIIGAGSVVCGDIPANVVAAGNPARVLMSLEAYREKRKAAQKAEAMALAAEYRAVFGRLPGAEELREFFWLFTEEGDALPGCWEEMFALQGKEALSRKAFRGHRKAFSDLDDFLNRVE